MKRPQRNLLAIAAIVPSLLVADKYLPPITILFTGLVFLVVALLLILLSKSFLIARSKGNKRDWLTAIEYYDKFERSLESSAFLSKIPIFMSIYTFDANALTCNNRAQYLMNLNQDDLAKQNLEQALAYDDEYSVPHVNLAILAARRGDEEEAERQLSLAQSLGFKIGGVQKLVRSIKAQVNTTIGDRLQ